ncbi:MAG: hypothetical protein ACK5V3_12620 [Bdellovibrionales bacterium]
MLYITIRSDVTTHIKLIDVPLFKVWNCVGYRDLRTGEYFFSKGTQVSKLFGRFRGVTAGYYDLYISFGEAQELPVSYIIIQNLKQWSDSIESKDKITRSVFLKIKLN